MSHLLDRGEPSVSETTFLQAFGVGIVSIDDAITLNHREQSIELNFELVGGLLYKVSTIAQSAVTFRLHGADLLAKLVLVGRGDHHPATPSFCFPSPLDEA